MFFLKFFHSSSISALHFGTILLFCLHLTSHVPSSSPCVCSPRSHMIWSLKRSYFLGIKSLKFANRWKTLRLRLDPPIFEASCALCTLTLAFSRPPLRTRRLFLGLSTCGFQRRSCPWLLRWFSYTTFTSQQNWVMQLHSYICTSKMHKNFYLSILWLWSTKSR